MLRALFILTLLTSCSLTPTENEKNISVTILLNQKTKDTQLKPSSYGLAPELLSDFDCFLVNILGSDLPYIERSKNASAPLNSIIHKQSYCSYFGLVSYKILATESPKSIRMDIKTGKDRLIQILGVYDPNDLFCNSQLDIKNTPLPSEVYLYEVAREFIPLLDTDRTIQLTSNYNNLTETEKIIRQSNCEQPPLTPVPVATKYEFEYYGSANIIGGTCNGPFTINFLDDDDIPTPVKSGTQLDVSVSGAHGNFHLDSSCLSSGYLDLLPIVFTNNTTTFDFYFSPTQGSPSSATFTTNTSLYPLPSVPAKNIPYQYSSCGAGQESFQAGQSNAGANAGSGDTYSKAQRITFNTQTTISNISFGGWVHPVTTPGSLTISLYQDSSNNPDTTSSIADCSATIPTSVGNISCSFTPPVSINAFQPVWIVAHNSNRSFIVQGCNGACNFQGDNAIPDPNFAKTYNGTWQMAPATALYYIFNINGCIF